jgi:mono/diheme cytochrome c family protein/thioredoxin-like negative regulator of GroEL
LGQEGRWADAIESARKKDVPAEEIQHEVNLVLIKSGQLYEETHVHLDVLIRAGVPQQDVAATLVHGCLAREELDRAKTMLMAWAADIPNQSHNAYMWGVYWQHLGESRRALKELDNALARQPSHELARVKIAECYEEQGRLDQALSAFVGLAAQSTHSELARTGLARVLRKMARTDEAREVVEPLASGPQPSTAVCLEMGRIELESGNSDAADRWFALVDPQQFADKDNVVTAAIAAALAGNATRAVRLFTARDEDTNISIGIRDLQSHLFFNPNDRKAAADLERLKQLVPDRSAFAEQITTELKKGVPPLDPAVTAADLYARHCSACHGANGDGNGRAAQHLFPKPRDLRTGRYQLVSTDNLVPSEEDIRLVIERGIPGTSMSPLEGLNEEQLRRLSGEVLRLRRQGIREEFVNLLKMDEEEVDEEEVEWVVEHRTTAGDVAYVPSIGSPDPQAIERGREVYEKQSCHSCHGLDGVGAWDSILVDDRHRPTRARDLVHEPLEGGRAPEAIYRRILLGMPGTPHPASKNLSDRQLIDLVHFCRSLARTPERVLTNHQRARRATGSAYLRALGRSPHGV